MKNNKAITGGLQGKNVVIANTLVRAAQGLSLAEKRMIFAAVAKMGGNFGEVVIYATEYATTFDLSTNNAYEQLKAAAENFFNRYFTVEVPGKKGVMRWKVRWLSKIGYEVGEGKVGLRFTDDVLPYLCDLTRDFTKYKLKQACALRSIHSWRLLELFEQQSSGWLNISVENFHHAMETSELQRSNFAHLRRKTIEPAIKELCNKDGWLIGFTFTKAGRKVDQLKFTFEKNPQQTLF